MFRRNQTPRRKTFNLDDQQISDDIKQLQSSTEEQEKLYECLDEKKTTDKKYTELQYFIKGTKNLEEIMDNLKSKANEIKELKEQLYYSVETIKTKTEEVLQAEIND